MSEPAIPIELFDRLVGTVDNELDVLGIASEMSSSASDRIADAIMPIVLAYAEQRAREIATEHLRRAAAVVALEHGEADTAAVIIEAVARDVSLGRAR